MRTRNVCAVLAATALLAACFGGGGGDTTTTPPVADPLAAVPAATAVSIGAIVDYQVQLAALNDAAESREPIDLTGVALASSETAEPTGL